MKLSQILLLAILLPQLTYGESTNSIESDEEKLTMKELLFLIEGPPTPPNPTLEMVKELNKKIDELTEQLTHIEDAFSEAQKNQSEIQQLNGQILQMTKRLKKAEKDLITTQENTQTQMTQLHGQVIDLSHQLTAAEKALDRSEKNNERLATQLHTQISDLNEQLNKTEGSLSKAQENEWRVTQLHSQVLELHKQLNKAEQSLSWQKPQEKIEVEPSKQDVETQPIENRQEEPNTPLEQITPVASNEPNRNIVVAPEKKPITKRMIPRKKRGSAQMKKRGMLNANRVVTEDQLDAKIEELNKRLSKTEEFLLNTQLSNEEALLVEEKIPSTQRKQRGFLKAKK